MQHQLRRGIQIGGVTQSRVQSPEEGKIQITDTSTGNGSAGDPFERIEYTFSAGSVIEQLYHGVLSVPNLDGLITVDYAAVGGPSTFTGSYNPVAGTQYFWVEGQEKTQTEVKYYKKNVFNLFGGGTWLDDALAGDESY